MLRGLLVYNREDYLKNSGYAQWLISEATENKIDLKLIYADDAYGKLGKKVDFVINRTRDFNISYIFELNGIRVYNNSKISFYGNNKLAAYALAEELGVKYSKVILNWNKGDRIISKPIYGHGGLGIEVFREGDGCMEYSNRYDSFNRNTFKQIVEEAIGDIRFYILDGKIIHSVIRKNENCILSNYSLGGKFELYEPSEGEVAVVKKITDAVYADFAGIDFLKMKDGAILFNEIEDVVGSRMLSELGCNDTVPKLIQHIARKKE